MVARFRETIPMVKSVLSYVPIGHQLADVLTKGLCNNVFHKNIRKLGMKDLYSPA